MKRYDLLEAKTDEEILNQYDKSVKHRASLELAIVNKLIKEANKREYWLAIGEFAYKFNLKIEADKFKSNLFNLDDSVVYVYDKDKNDIGWILFVFGNDGWDCISDYTVTLENFLKPINEFAETLYLFRR